MDNNINPSNNYKLNKIEHDIKNAINNMRIQIEKQAKNTKKINTITPEISKNKLASSPNLVFIFKKKKVKKMLAKKLYNLQY